MRNVYTKLTGNTFNYSSDILNEHNINSSHKYVEYNTYTNVFFSYFFLVFLAAMAQNSSVGSFNVSSWTANVWIQRAYPYWSSISTNVTLTFIFQTNKKDGWYLDDVSVRNPSSVELLINGNFESNPLTNGWTTGSLGSCGSDAGGTSSGCHSSSQCYYDVCDGGYIWISQSFAVIAGNVYNISFWCYYSYGGPGGGSNPVQMNMTINWSIFKNIFIDMKMWIDSMHCSLQLKISVNWIYSSFVLCIYMNLFFKYTNVIFIWL